LTAAIAKGGPSRVPAGPPKRVIRFVAYATVLVNAADRFLEIEASSSAKDDPKPIVFN
jgi:hypothetical protein